ncbi:MAG: hypothetical protein ACKO2Y_04725 [Actinomycetota bacterium]
MSDSDADELDVSRVTAASRPLRWALTGSARWGDGASAVYGTILTASLLIAVGGGPVMVMGSIALTALIFWLAHVHVAILRRVVRTGEHVRWPAARAALVEEWPLAQASLTPLAPILLAALGLLALPTARWIGVGICVVELVAWGVAISRLAHLGRRGTALTIGINVVLGVTLIGLKLVVH